MDPDACLKLMHEQLDSLRKGDEDARDEVVAALRDLADWLKQGGFPPRVGYVRAE